MSTLTSALGLNVVRLPCLPFQLQFNGTHQTRGSPGGKVHITPLCHGGSALTSSIGYTHPTMTVSSLWCGSRACLFFRNPLKVALNGKRTKRPQRYYRSTLVGVLSWWVCESGPALLRATTSGLYCLVRPVLILVVICNPQHSKPIRLIRATLELCSSWGCRVFIVLLMIDKKTFRPWRTDCILFQSLYLLLKVSVTFKSKWVP